VAAFAEVSLDLLRRLVAQVFLAGGLHSAPPALRASAAACASPSVVKETDRSIS
jgi:hypothetical protein